MDSPTEDSVTVATSTLAACIVPPTTAPTRRGRPRQEYRCAFCAKAFKRNEHCIRHQRTHTLEKPYCCRYCSKAYSRQDLVTRHERTLHAEAHHERMNGITSSVKGHSRQQAKDTTSKTTQGSLARADHSDSSSRHVRDSDLVRPTSSDDAPRSPTYSSPSSESDTASLTCVSASSAQKGGPLVRFSSSPGATEAIGRARRQSAPALLASTRPHMTRLHSASASVNVGPESAPRDLISLNSFALGASVQQQTKTSDRPSGPELQMMGTGTDLGLTGMNSCVSPTEAHIHNFMFPPNPSMQETQPDVIMGNSSAGSSFSRMPDFAFSPSSLFPAPLAPNNQVPESWPMDETNQPRLQSMMQERFDLQFTDQTSTNNHLAGNEAIRGRQNSSSSGSQMEFGLPYLKDRDKKQNYPNVIIDDNIRETMANDLLHRVQDPTILVHIPSTKVCQGYLTSYINRFQSHLPILHLPTLCPLKTPSPLTLAMCSIGALYRLDRRRARHLYDLATRAVQNSPPLFYTNPDRLVKEYDLWYTQARIMLAFYAIMSGEPDLLSSVMQDNGFFSMVYNKAKASLEMSNLDQERPMGEKWIEVESWKRVLGALFIVSTMGMTLFNVNPGFNATQDLEFPLFDDEQLWNADSLGETQDAWTNYTIQNRHEPKKTMKEALMDIMVGGKYSQDALPYQVSAFSALVLMHGVVVQMWQRMQVSQVIAVSWASHQGGDVLGSSLLDNSMRTLARCEAFLKSTGEISPGGGAEDGATTSIIFNCQAILRVAYIRLFETGGSLSRISLLGLDPTVQTESACNLFVSSRLNRGPQVLEAVKKAMEGLSTPVKLGTMLIRKTAAFQWGVEHAVAGWEAALLVTKWIHDVESDILHATPPSAEESQMLATINDILQEAEHEFNKTSSLAASTARIWSWFLQDVWVWGITPRMGASLSLLAEAYERARDHGRIEGLSDVMSLNQIPSFNTAIFF